MEAWLIPRRRAACPVVRAGRPSTVMRMSGTAVVLLDDGPELLVRHDLLEAGRVEQFVAGGVVVDAGRMACSIVSWRVV